METTAIKLSANLTTDLRKCVAEHVRYSATSHVLATAHGERAYLTATDARILAVVPVEAEAPESLETYMPAGLAFGKEGKGTRVVLNGEWRREEKGNRGASKVTCLPPISDADNLRFPRAETVLPNNLTAESVIRLRIDARLLANLADAIGEGGAITLLIPTGGNSASVCDVRRGILAAMGANGIGAIVTMVSESPVADDCASYNRAADAYAETRKAAQAAMLDRQAKAASASDAGAA